jgi:hypothetical protein
MAEPAENLTVVEGPEKPKLTPTELVVQDNSEFAMLFDSARFNQAWRAATMFSNSKLVPADFRGSPESCFVAMHMAVRLNLDPMMVMQKTYIIHGRPGMEAQLIIALVNARGPFTGPIQWETSGTGDTREWIAFATHKGTGERCTAKVDWAMVKAEGWAGKSGSKWMTIPDLMGRYRSATFLARLYCPEVIMGLSTVEELRDMEPEIVEATVTTLHKVPQTEKVKEALKRTRKPKEPDTPPETPPQENLSPGDPSAPPRGITEKTHNEILTLSRKKDYPMAMLLADYEVTAITELTEEAGQNALKFLKGLPDVE